MIVYNALKNEFVNDVKEDTLISKIENNFFSLIGGTSPNEIRSWKNSLTQMRNVIDDKSIPDNAGIAIEFNIPYTSKRVDFIISGYNEKNHNAAVIVELKQWETIDKVPTKDGIIVKTFLGGGKRETIHPSYQAYTYAKMIADFNQSVQDENIALYPCAYLHNYELKSNDDLVNKIYKPYLDVAPVFTNGEAVKLRKFITTKIKYGDNEETLFKIDNGRLRPSKSLQNCLCSMLHNNEEFVMIDDQKVVYEKALELGKASYLDGKRRVLIVKGGPGTGKSVLAINLLVNLTKFGAACTYVTKNSAPRIAYKTLLKQGHFKTKVIDELFMSSGSFWCSQPKTFDVIICDEAHRLNLKSGMFKNKGENQMKEIINASKFSVFFIDEHQRIDISDAGSINEIKKLSHELGAEEVVEMQLLSQFRCDGSDGYLSWIDNTLQISQTANFDGFDDYDFRVVDTPQELTRLIGEKNKISNKSRIVAGYCWDWIHGEENNPDVHDIHIGDFNASWNLRDNGPWAIEDTSFDQIGCIHTCQGLEFDYVGVIIGDDIYVDNGIVHTNWRKRASTDRSIKGLKSMSKKNPAEADKIGDELIRNTYRTLMTRGMKGCYVYCVDKTFANYLRTRFKGENNG